jgi:hypothetical protein
LAINRQDFIVCYEKPYSSSTNAIDLDGCKNRSQDGTFIVGGYYYSNPNLLLLAAEGPV